MSKKSKKRRRKKLSTSSSEEEEEVSKGQDVTNSCKSVMSKQDVKSQESCAKEKEKSVSSPIKDDSQSTRQIKKPVYRLAKTQATEQKIVNKEEKCTKTYLEKNCSSRAKNYVSGKDKTISGSKTVERGPSKPLNTNTGTAPQRTAKMSKGWLDERSSQRSPSRLKRMSPSLVSVEQEEQRRGIQSKKCRAEVPPWTGNESSTMKTREPTSSFSKDSLRQKRRELVKKMCQRHPEKELKAKRSLSTDAKISSASITKTSSTSVKHTTSESSSKMQVVEEIDRARSERRLEVNLMQSYGELTCMDIDSPEEGPANTHSRLLPQEGVILVLDTNILLSHLDYVKKIRSHGLGGLGFPVVLIPWVVLQELDSLKGGKGLSGSVAHLATPAISYIYNSLKNRQPHLWGQSMQQAADSSNGLNAENNDDRVLQCCLQYRSLYPECALILCTNDKNLCSKALLSGVNAFSKNDLEAEVERSRHGLQRLQNNQPPMLPHINPQVSSPLLSKSCTPVQPHSQEKTGLSVGLLKDSKRLSEADEKTKWNLGRCVSELENCLREVLSDVLEVEMKAAYEDLWLEIVHLKPPWTLGDVLRCLKKHWIAVFGHIVPRRNLQTVLNLINFFNLGETVDCSSTSKVLQEAKELVKAFWKSSSHVPRAISVMDNIFKKLQPQRAHGGSLQSVEGESSACDVVMNDDDNDDEDKQATTGLVSHQEVWAVFESIWSNLWQTSLGVFKALGFDPHIMQSAQPAGGPPPPQDALACLHRLSSMVSQLLQAFSSVLSSTPGLEEVQTLLSIMHSNKVVNEDSKLTAKDLRDCFSKHEYREKLRVGGSQLMELQEALDRCVRATGQHITFTT